MKRLAPIFLVGLILAFTSCERQSVSVLSQIEHQAAHESTAPASNAKTH